MNNFALFCGTISHRIGGNPKTLILSTNVDQKSLETEFLNAICRPTGDKWQSKSLLLAIFDPDPRQFVERHFVEYDIWSNKTTGRM